MSENARLIYADLQTPETAEALEAADMIRNHYRSLGAKAVVFMDKDNTTIHMEEGIPTDPRLEGVIVSAQEKGIIVSYDSDSSDMIIVPDGSVFWKGVGFKEIVAETTQQLTGRSIRFIEIPDRAIIGAAMLVT